MKKVLLPTLLSLLLLLVLVPGVSAASVGSTQVEPGKEWNRYGYDAPEITYYGGKWFVAPTIPSTWNSPYNTLGTGFKFNFTGTKLRLISTTWSTGSDDIDVLVDGQKIKNFSLAGEEVVKKQVMFEVTGLPLKEHTIEFVNNKSKYLFFYFIDVDGELKPHNPDTNPTEPQPTGDRAILTVTMTTGLEKEYDLSMDEVNAFISWYDAKDAGSGPSKYAINKHDNNKGPFSKRTDYVIFNNILTFEVNEYTTVTSATYSK